MGMANLDVLCGLTPQATLEDVVKGRARLRDVLVTGPGGFQLVPGASGVAAMANLDGRRPSAPVTVRPISLPSQTTEIGVFSKPNNSGSVIAMIAEGSCMKQDRVPVFAS